MRYLNQKGNIYIPVLIIITLFVSLGITATTYVMNQAKLANQFRDKEIAFQMAEAGVEYYRWHLAHDQDDYQDGTGAPGPYVHTYTDTLGNELGSFTLDITPPPNGSTVVNVDSTGSLVGQTSPTRTLAVTMGIPSFTEFAVAANDNMRFGEGTEIYGPVHANKGIRFDGYAHSLMTSSADVYNDTDSDDCTAEDEWAVHTCLTPADPAPPTEWPLRTDVFGGGRRVDVSSISFTSITDELDKMEKAAGTNGILLGSSGVEGYYVHFNPDSTLDIYKVDSQKTCRRQICIWLFCWWSNYTSHNLYSYDEDNLSAFTIESQSSVGMPMPDNGLIFLGDDVWVDGQINGDRITVVAAEHPLATGNANLIVNKDLLYTNYDGTDAIGLIAQNNLFAGFFSEGSFSGTADDQEMRIDAALIAQNGMVGRLNYGKSSNTDYVDEDGNSCGNDNAHRNTLTNYGALASNRRYGFAYVGNNYNCGTFDHASGYCTRNLHYDENFYFGPPPFFPSTGRYEIITWHEKE